MPKSDSASPKKPTKTVKAKTSAKSTLETSEKPVAKRKPTAKPINEKISADTPPSTQSGEKTAKVTPKVKKAVKTTKAVTASKDEKAAPKKISKAKVKKAQAEAQTAALEASQKAVERGNTPVLKNPVQETTNVKEISSPLNAQIQAPAKEIKSVIEKVAADQGKAGVVRISTPPRHQQQQPHETRLPKEYNPQRDFNKDRKPAPIQHNQNRIPIDPETGFALPETVGGEFGNKRNKRRRNRNKGRQDLPYASEAPTQIQVDSKELARKAWKIFLGEVTEDGLALMDDPSTKEIAAKAFRVAELFLMEKTYQARRHQPTQPTHQRSFPDQPKPTPVIVPETKVNLIPDPEDIEEMIYDIDRDEDAFSRNITEVQEIFASDDAPDFLSDDELDV